MDGARPVTIEEWEAVAREVLPVGVFDYIAGGAGAERTLAENEAAFERLRVWPRMLRASGSPDPHTEVLGMPLAFPIAIAPWAFQSQVHPGGERATAAAAAAMGTAMCVSSTVLDGLEDVAAAGGILWWQLYIWRDREASAALLPARAGGGVPRGHLDGGRPGPRAATSRHEERLRPAGGPGRHAPGVRPRHLLG